MICEKIKRAEIFLYSAGEPLEVAELSVRIVIRGITTKAASSTATIE